MPDTFSANTAAFEPPRDWDAIYADPDSYFFGMEPSQIAHTALRFFRALGGDPATATALDLGSGEGRDTAFLAEAGMHVTARDVSRVGLEKTQALLAGAASPRSGLTWRRKTPVTFLIPPPPTIWHKRSMCISFCRPPTFPAISHA